MPDPFFPHCVPLSDHCPILLHVWSEFWGPPYTDRTCGPRFRKRRTGAALSSQFQRFQAFLLHEEWTGRDKQGHLSATSATQAQPIRTNFNLLCEPSTRRGRPSPHHSRGSVAVPSILIARSFLREKGILTSISPGTYFRLHGGDR